MAEAAAAIDKAIALAPKRAHAYFLSTTYARVKPDDRRLAAMEALAADMASLSADEQIDLNFALAKAYRDLGDAERSFPRLAAGAALKRKIAPYDEASVLRGFETVAADVHARTDGAPGGRRRRVADAGLHRRHAALGNDPDRTDPRRHPQAFGAGEIGDFRMAVEALRASDKIGGLSGVSPRASTGQQARARRRLRRGASARSRLRPRASSTRRRPISPSSASSASRCPTRASSMRAATRWTPAFPASRRSSSCRPRPTPTTSASSAASTAPTRR